MQLQFLYCPLDAAAVVNSDCIEVNEENKYKVNAVFIQQEEIFTIKVPVEGTFRSLQDRCVYNTLLFAPGLPAW